LPFGSLPNIAVAAWFLAEWPLENGSKMGHLARQLVLGSKNLWIKKKSAVFGLKIACRDGAVKASLDS